MPKKSPRLGAFEWREGKFPPAFYWGHISFSFRLGRCAHSKEHQIPFPCSELPFLLAVSVFSTSQCLNFAVIGGLNYHRIAGPCRQKDSPEARVSTSALCWFKPHGVCLNNGGENPASLLPAILGTPLLHPGYSGNFSCSMASGRWKYQAHRPRGGNPVDPGSRLCVLEPVWMAAVTAFRVGESEIG